MSTIKKKLEKFYKSPIPNDITFQDVKVIAEYFKCIVVAGGNHMKVIHIDSGTVITIPRHGKNVKEAYIKQLKILFNSIMEKN